MAIDNVVFPTPKLIHGMKKTSEIPTRIVSNGNTEYRIRTNAFERFVWEFPASTITDDQIKQIIQFWGERGGGLKAFKFQDPDYPNFVDAKLASAGGSKWFLRIPFDNNTPGIHRVFNFHIPDYTCKRNGNTASISSVQIEPTGEPTITVSGSGPADTIRISGPCYLSARFDSSLSWILTSLNSNNLRNISTYDTIRLYEVFETTI